MTEIRAVLMGFGAVAVAMIGVAAWLLAVAMGWRTPGPQPTDADVDGAISKLFLRTEKAPGSPLSTRHIPHISGLLPGGMPGQDALDRLAANHFDCRTNRDLVTCERSHPSGICNFHWRVFLVLRGDRFVASTSADSHADCL